MTDAPTPPPAPIPPDRVARRRSLGLRVLLVLYFVVALGLLGLRYWVLPNVDAYRAEIAASVSERLGLPVSIGAVSAQWAGLRPTLHFADVRISDRDGRTALALQRIEANLAWQSVARGYPVFARLEIVAPQLDVRREPDGRVLVAGIVLDAQAQGGGIGPWLLEQAEIVVRGARVVWTDGLRAAPPLVLDQLDFRLENRGERHRFGLVATPPVHLSTAIDLRGELFGHELARWREWRGELYVNLPQAELGGWQAWVDYPVPLAGRGGVSAWVSFDGPQVYAGRLDLALAGARTRLREDLPELVLERLAGSVRTRRTGGAWHLETRELTLAGEGGLALSPVSLALDYAAGEDGKGAAGSFSVDQLDIAALATLVPYLPLEAAAVERIAALAPAGRMHRLKLSWRGPLAAPSEWQVEGQAEGVGLAPGPGWPGLAGLSGSFEGDQDQGRYRISGRDAALDLPMVFPEPRLALSEVNAQGRWQRRDGRIEILLDQADFENPDATGSASGSYRLSGDGPGEIDLEARLTRADGTAVWRYMPLVVNAETRNWLRDAIVGGASSDARLRLRGDLREFPFAERKTGQFLVTARIAGARLDYAAGWPAIDDIHGELRFEGAGMRITAERGRVGEAQIGRTVAEITDLRLPEEMLLVRGSAAGPTQSFLDFVNSSPVGKWINGITEEMRAEGAGSLDLALDLPLRRIHESQVKGEYRFAGNSVRVFPELPELGDAGARIAFTADTLGIADGAARLLGEPVMVRGQTQADGALLINASGTASAAAFRRVSGAPVFDHLSGRSAWSAEIGVRGRGAQVLVSSELLGLSSSLPPPFNKSALAAMPLRLQFEALEGGSRQHWQLALGEGVRGELWRRRGDAGAWRLERGGVALNAPLRMAEGGVMAAIDLPDLDLDAWRAAIDGKSSGGGGLPLAGLALRSQRLTLFGERIEGVDLRAISDAGGWRGRLEGEAIDGEFDWRSRDQGALKAHFRRLVLGSGKHADASPRPAEDAAEDDPASLPALDVTAERFRLGEMELGKLRLLARNRGSQWLLDDLALTQPQGELQGSGRWRPGGQTELGFTATISDIGAYLGQIGYVDAVRQGRARLSGQLGWQGAPTSVDYPSLAGRIDVEAEGGQFNKLEPGVGRLLGVLSLQALPRRITLDFRDVFSDGFAFDRIQGGVRVSAGVMRSDELAIRGPAARVRLDGSVDLAAETQDLIVSVQPTLTESVAVGAAIANSAAGLLNPVAGVVTYLAQKIMQDPIEKLFSYQYSVTGSWDDPRVERVHASTESAPADAVGQ